MGDEVLDRKACRVAQQKAGFQADIVDAGGGESCRAVAQQRIVGPGQAASSAKRPA